MMGITKKHGFDVSIVLPRFTESFDIVERTTKKIAEINKNYRTELIIVNDGPNNHYYDEVVRRIRSNFEGIRVISNGGNFGKGYSVRRGVDLAAGKYVFYSDIDFPVACDDFFEAYRILSNDESDIVIGERYSSNPVRANTYRAFTSRMFLKIFNKMFDPRILDTQCPFKMFKAEVAKEIFSNQRINGYAFDAEILHIAGLLDQRITQLAILWEDTRENWHLLKTIRNYSKMIIDLILVKLRSTGAPNLIEAANESRGKE